MYFSNHINISRIFILFILISTIKKSIQIIDTDFTLPVSLTLLDYSIALVCNSGIRFYDQEFNVEYTDKKISLTITDISKVLMGQFSSENGGYIIIYVNNIFHIFDSDKNLLKTQEMTDNEIIYSFPTSLVPYKKVSNLLIFILSYLYNNNNNIGISSINFDLNNAENNLTITKKNIITLFKENEYYIGKQGISCVLMPSTNKELLTCFSFRSESKELTSFTLELGDEYTEDTSLRVYKIFTGEYSNFQIKGLTSLQNENKDKILIYFVVDELPYWVTFDYNNKFSEIHLENIKKGLQFGFGFIRHKLFYFNKNKEFLAVSDYSSNCEKLVIAFNDNCEKLYKGTLYFNDQNCYYTNSFTVINNGLNYTIITDGGGVSFSFHASSNEIVQDIEENINTETESGTKIITTFIEAKIPTTITTTYIEVETPTTIMTTYIEAKIPTTIITTFIEQTPTTIMTTYIETKSPTTIITTFIEQIPTTIITTYIETKSPTTIITTFIEQTPTTIMTTYTETKSPTTIITTFIEQTPATIMTTYTETKSPTTIITTFIEQIPTTITTTHIETKTPTTIITTYIDTNMPTTIVTTYSETKIPSTITSTYTEVEVPSTIATTLLKAEIPTTITTTYIETQIPISITTIYAGENYEKNIKCNISSYESFLYDLCISCNIEQNYFPASYPDDSFLHGFIECFNENTKPINFYFDNSDKKYKPCYETCLTCSKGGNSQINNCLTCDTNYIKKPEDLNTTNCVTECFYLYYFTPFGQYKCTNNSYCPEEAHLFIKDLKKCTDNCNKEGKYQYQYGGQCIENCPDSTSPNEEKKCIVKNPYSCSKSDREIELKEFLISGGVEFSAKNYANEFSYTEKHVSFYHNNIYSIIIYKDLTCIDELSINMPKVDFGDCYTKIQEKLDPPTDDKIIIALVEKVNGEKKSSISFTFYHPQTGEKIDAERICKDEEVEVKESVLSQLNNTNVDLNSVLFLTNQQIDIFNLSDAFYSDICYHFDSPNGKDVPLQDRIKTYYPNITLCDAGCISKGVNLTTLESICNCKFDALLNSEFVGKTAIIQNTLEEISDLLKSSNILVVQCYKNVFNKKYFFKSTGGFMVLAVLFIEIVFALVFLLNDVPKIRRYLYIVLSI